MKPSATVITLGVQNLKTSLRFYKDGLKWPTSASEEDPIAFFKLTGIILALYPRHLLAEDAMTSDNGKGFGGITLAHNVASEAEVVSVLAEAEAAGARIVKKAQRVFWGGFSGYFADPDGYLWEVAHNPHWKLDEQGKVVLP